MKKNPVPQAIQITQHQLDLLRHAILLMLMSLLTITLFAGSEVPGSLSNLSSFTAALHQQKVVLQWAVNDEKGMSHYTIERSSNGNEYTDIATVFTGESSPTVQQYNFQENIPAASGTLYYRLKMVNSNGNAIYSEIRIIKAGQQTEDYLINIHPDTNIAYQKAISPASWQNKFVNISSFKQNGRSVNVLMINNSIPDQSVVVE